MAKVYEVSVTGCEWDGYPNMYQTRSLAIFAEPEEANQFKIELMLDFEEDDGYSYNRKLHVDERVVYESIEEARANGAFEN